MSIIYKYFKGVGGVINNQLFLTTQKVGSTTLETASSDSFFYDETTLLFEIKKFQKKYSSTSPVILFLRSPKERLISGIGENFIYDAVLRNKHYDSFVIDLVHKNSKKYLALKKFCEDNYTEWMSGGGVPPKHRPAVAELAELYINITAEKDTYWQPHVMPFYTPISKFFKDNQINFKTIHLKDYDFRLEPRALFKARHSNKAYTQIIEEVFDKTENKYLEKMLRDETASYNYFLNFLEPIFVTI